MKRIIIIFFFVISPIGMLAAELKGIVYGKNSEEQKTPLVKATVQWMNTNEGTLTNSNGEFTLAKSKKSNKLVVSFIGYKKDTIAINNFSERLIINLIPDLTLDEVVVKDKMSDRLVMVTQSAIKSEITSLRGLQKAACCNLSESFQTNPSVDVSFTNAVTGAKQIQMLGLQGVYIQLLNEQMPAMRGLSSMMGLEYIPGPWMESIQISKGLASVTTGFESISGQINVEYKKPDNSEPFFFNTYFNNIGRFEVNATSAMKLNDNLSTIFYGHSSFNQVKYDKNGDSFLDRPLSKQFNFMNRWKYANNNFISQTYIKALYDQKDGGQSNFWHDKNSNYYGMRIKSEKYEVSTKNGYVFDSDIYHSLAIVGSLTHYKINSFFDTTGYSGEQNSIYLKLMYETHIADSTNKLVVGGSFSNDNIIEYVKPINYKKSTSILEPKVETIPGLFAEYTYTGIKNLTVMGGFRADFLKTKYLDTTINNTFLSPRFHIQYRFNDNNSIRLSAGKGFRISNIHAEDIGMFASSRAMYMGYNENSKEKLKPEEAWNYGINGTTIFNLFDYDFTLNAEYYRTEFINQVIMNMERSTTAMYVYNLRGKSYSNSFQIDLSFEPLYGLTLTSAFRINDVKTEIDGKLTDKALQSRTKGFLNLVYVTPSDDWNFDFTAEYNGSGRIISTASNPEQYRMDETFPSYVLLHGQITKKFNGFDLYLGGENLTNFTQKQVIISADNPKGKYFEGSFVWGPVLGRIIYLGTRLSI